MFDMKKAGEQIALFRKEKGFTQEKLAEALSVSPQAVSKWENGRALPETSLLPPLARLLDCSIDALLMPNELQILDAVYTDGSTCSHVTNKLNRLIDNNSLHLPADSRTFPQAAESERAWFLLVKYANNAGTYYSYARQGDLLDLDADTIGYSVPEAKLQILDAYYGNRESSSNVMSKIEHYQFFNRGQYQANHETFPSNPATSGTEYLSVLYINDEGLHLAVCEEGESLVLSRDGRDLRREPRSADRKVIEGVASLQWGKEMDCSWAGALTVALKAMGEDTTYEKVMGVSGACYRLAFCRPTWDYSSVDGLVAYDYATPAYRAFGYEPVFAERVEKKHRDDERENILRSLNHDRPVLAINLRCAPEWGVITGYEDQGKTLLCRTYYDKEIIDRELGGTDQYLKADNWPFIILHFGCRTTPPSQEENLTNSLRVLIDCNEQVQERGYYMGHHAYAVWEEDLRDDSLFEAAEEETYWRLSSVNHFCMMALVDARRCACRYLAESAALFEGKKQDLLLSMADKFRQVYELTEGIFRQLYDLCPSRAAEAKKLWARDLRLAQAEVLHQSSALEKEAENLAREFLA